MAVAAVQAQARSEREAASLDTPCIDTTSLCMCRRGYLCARPTAGTLSPRVSTSRPFLALTSAVITLVIVVMPAAPSLGTLLSMVMVLVLVLVFVFVFVVGVWCVENRVQVIRVLGLLVRAVSVVASAGVCSVLRVVLPGDFAQALVTQPAAGTTGRVTAGIVRSLRMMMVVMMVVAVAVAEHTTITDQALPVFAMWAWSVRCLCL